MTGSARCALTAALLIAPGCYASSHNRVDGDADGAVDAIHDTLFDTAPDTAADTVADTPADTVPDTSADVSVDTGVDPTPECPPADPPPEGPVVDFLVDGSSWPGHLDLYRQCVVSAVEHGVEGVTVDMTCTTEDGGDEEHRIEIYASPDPWIALWEGQDVVFRYFADPIWWVNEYFTVSYPYDGRMIVGGLRASEPSPPIFEDFWYPVGLRPVETSCPLRAEECYDAQRGALEVSVDGTSTTVFDSTIAYAGTWSAYGVYLDVAETRTDFRCTDIPASWYAALILETGWD